MTANEALLWYTLLTNIGIHVGQGNNWKKNESNTRDVSRMEIGISSFIRRAQNFHHGWKMLYDSRIPIGKLFAVSSREIN